MEFFQKLHEHSIRSDCHHAAQLLVLKWKQWKGKAKCTRKMEDKIRFLKLLLNTKVGPTESRRILPQQLFPFFTLCRHNHTAYHFSACAKKLRSRKSLQLIVSSVSGLPECSASIEMTALPSQRSTSLYS